MANKKLNQLVTKPSIASGDLFPIADATTGQLYKTTISDLGTAIGSGVSSVNGLVGAVVLDTDDIQELASPVNKWFTDLRARAAISVSSPLAYNSGTGLITIAQATGSANGYLSSTDWTTFNSKQAALSGTGFVKISGTTISYDNSTYLTTSAAATNYVPYTGATANVNLGLNYSLTAALIIKSGGTSTQFLKADGSIDTNTYLTTGSAASTYLPLSGGTISGDLTISSTNPRIYLTDTDNNPDYFISNTDGTFTIYDVTSSVSRFTLNGTTGTFGGNLTVGSIIKSGGTSAQFLKADGSVDSNSYALTSQLHNAVTIGTANGLTLSTQVLSLGLASSTANGALSSTDWTTFNNKQNALTNPVTGTGTSGIVAVFNGTSSITDSTIYANSTRVSIGADITTTNRFTAVSSTTSAYAVVAQASSAAHGIWSNVLGTGEIFRGQTAGGSYFIINNGGNAFLNGNLNVGDFASTSYRLNVVGTANITGALSGTSATFTSSGQSLQLTSTSDVYLNVTRGSSFVNIGVDSTGTFYNTNSNHRWLYNSGGNEAMRITSSGNVGIGTTSPSQKLHVTGSGDVVSLVETAAGAFAQYRLLASPGGTPWVFGTQSDYLSNSLVFRNSTNKMVLTTGGNLGIGTDSPADYSGYTTLHLNGKSGANGGVLRLTAYDSTSSANIYAGNSALNINTTSAVPIKFLTRDTTRMQILDSGAIIAGNLMGNQYSMTSGSGTGTAIVDTGITYNTGDYGGYGRGVTYEVVFNGNPNGNGSAAYFAQYMGILIIYTGWSGSAVTTYIQYTQLAGGNNIGALTLTPVFWNGSTESSSIGVYTTGAQIRLKISGYNSGATGQDQSVYLRRIS